MSDQNEELLKAAELSLRDTVAKLGNSHPEVYKMLTQYIALLRQCGKNDTADKLDARAKALKDILDREAAAKAEEAKAAEAARAAEEAKKAEAARAEKAAEAAREAELAKAVMQSAAPQADKKSTIAEKAQKAKAAAEEGVFDLDMFEDEDEESMAMALELVKETPSITKPRSVDDTPPAAQATSDEPVFLFNSKGEHIAVAVKGALYSPQGENIGRMLDDYGVFLDRSGWYLGQIVDGNRLAREEAWIHRHLNFGDRGNEGNRSGWGRCADIERTYFDRGWEDVKLDEE